MHIFSNVHHPVIVPYAPNKNGTGRKTLEILPGRTLCDDETWEKIKPRLTSRLDRGMLRYSPDLSQDLNDGEKARLLQQAGAENITQLCSKASPVDDGKIAGTDDYELVENLKKQKRA